MAKSCNSLGFGLGAKNTPANVSLILIDNGSQDRTWQVMVQIREHSANGSVLMVREPTRGYVPARHAGLIAARKFANDHLIQQDELLVLQADADTVYAEGYVTAMRAAAADQSNFFLHGTSGMPPKFAGEYPQYIALSRCADEPIRDLWLDEADDVIVGDNASGYRLADYFRWGGHVREFNSVGDEILAESSRLFIKAKFAGGRLLSVPDAVAYHSKRKIIADPISQFVTAGFPREKRWYANWRRRYAGPCTMEELKDGHVDQAIKEAVLLRQAHSLILFGLLPAYVAKLVGRTNSNRRLSRFDNLFSYMDGLTQQQTVSNTAALFERAFGIIDSHPKVLEDCLRDE